MPNLFDQIAELLRQERAYFGDTVVIDPRVQQEPRAPAAHPPASQTNALQMSAPRPTRPARPPASPHESARADTGMMLFDLPETSPSGITNEPWGATTSLDDLDRMISGCLKCPLGHTRTKFVFGVGNPNADLMLIGEAPGADEDAQGEPFVGKAGLLLNKILEAIQLRRQDVYICNILKCRPPGNRKPLAEEADQCLPYLRKQIALIRPKLILCLGLTAAENLLQTTESLTRLRGNVLRFEGTPLMVTYHPAALLRNPNWKRPAWEDVQAAKRLLDSLKAEGKV